MISVYKPYLPQHVLKYAHDAINSTWISGYGKYLDLVKNELKEITGSKYVILTNNGTAATHLLSVALKFKHPNINNLIVPSNVYIAAWNAFKMGPIYNFELVDSNIETWNIDISKLKVEEKSKAVLIVHNLGNIVNVPKLKRDYPNYIFIEDNCEGFMGKYEEKCSGTDSLASSVSFFGNKTFTSGEGGAFFTNDTDIFKYINSVKSQGITDEKFIFDKLGYNYRMTNVQAAILYGQLKYKNEIIERKENVFRKYKDLLRNCENIIFQKEENNTKRANWMFALRIRDFNLDKLKDLELYLYKNNIEIRPMFPDINKHKHLKTNKIFPNSERLYEQVIILPSYPELTNSQIEFIASRLINKIKK